MKTQRLQQSDTHQLQLMEMMGFRRLNSSIGLDFAQLSANLGRNLMEGRIGILTAVFEAA